MGKYKEKSCKFCQTKHRKRGPYCCQSCANRDRTEYSANVAIAMRKVAIEYNKTPEAIAKQKLLSLNINSDDFAIDIPEIKTLEDFIEFTEGYDKAEKW
jgi:hypothetical protein